MYAASNAQAALRIQDVGFVKCGGDRRHTPEQFRRFDYRMTPCKALRRLGAVTVNLSVLQTDDGFRRFFPTRSGLTLLVEQIARMGFALLAQRRSYDPCQREALFSKIAMMRCTFHLREYIGLRLLKPDRLTIAKNLRIHLGREDVLPEDLGITGSHETRWDVGTLLRQGRLAAQCDGWQEPDDHTCVVYGWCAAGRQVPLKLSEEEITSLLRLAMFDCDQESAPLSVVQEAALLERFCSLVRRRGGVHAQDSLGGGKGNSLRDLATARYVENGVAGRLGRDLARRGILEFGWRSFFYVAEAIETCAIYLADLLLDPLDDYERQYFRATFFRHRYLGGLSLFLVAQRCSMLRPLLAELWERPDDEAIAEALHASLHAFAEAVPVVRRLERLKKERPPRTDSILEGFDPGAASEITSLQLYADAVERRGIHCRKCTKCPDVFYLEPSGDGGRFQISCPAHGCITQIELSLDELKKAAENISESSGNFARSRQDKPKKPR